MKLMNRKKHNKEDASEVSFSEDDDESVQLRSTISISSLTDISPKFGPKLIIKPKFSKKN